MLRISNVKKTEGADKTKLYLVYTRIYVAISYKLISYRKLYCNISFFKTGMRLDSWEQIEYEFFRFSLHIM